MMVGRVMIGGNSQGFLRQAWVIEGLLTLAVLLFLLWQAKAFYREEFRADVHERYAADQALAIQLPPAPQLKPSDNPAQINAQLQQALNALQNHLSNRLDKQSEQDKASVELARVSPEGASLVGKASTNAMPTEQDDSLAFYRKTYGIRNINTPEAPVWQVQPLACAAGWLAEAKSVVGEADSQRLLAAMLAGETKAIRAWLQQENRRLPAASANLSSTACSGVDSLGMALSQATFLVQKAYKSMEVAAKGDLAEPLPTRAIAFFACYVVLAWSLLQGGRRALANPWQFFTCAIALWAGVAWWTNVPVPFTWPLWLRHGFFPALAACAVVTFAVLTWLWHPKSTPLPRQTVNSRLAFPGVVLLLGLGWWLLIDLCIHGHPKNRFLALEQQRNLFFCFVVLSLLPSFRFYFLGAMLRLYSLRMRLINNDHAVAKWLPWVISTAILIVLVVGLHQYRQLTSEIFRVLFLFSFSFLLFLRGESLLKTRDTGLFFYFLKPFALFFVLFVAGQFFTDDQGPLLVTFYGGLIIVGGMLATWLYEDGRTWGRSLVVSTVVVTTLIAVTTWGVFAVGQFHDTTRTRIESALNPYGSANDQMAILHYFRDSIPATGYGLGDVPWCGNELGNHCTGMPLQTQSDYIFTAIQGVWGRGGAVVLLVFIVFWVRHLILYHPKITDGRYDPANYFASLQAWASWLNLCWLILLLTQLSVTVAGNLGWLPLTGITFPFMSFGVWSLFSNAVFLGLNLNLLPKSAT